MADKSVECNEGNTEGVPAALKNLWNSVGVKGLAGFLAVLFLNFIMMPTVKYNKNTDEFTVEFPARAVTLHARPQMCVRYGNNVIILTHLLGYYERETVYFEDNKASLTKANQEHAERLISYVRSAVLAELREDDLPDATIAEIGAQMSIYMSMICGINYEPRFGNTDNNRYCIIENNGMLVDCACDSSKVKNRLCDYELVLDGNIDSISTSVEIQQLVCTVVKEVRALYDN